MHKWASMVKTSEYEHCDEGRTADNKDVYCIWHALKRSTCCHLRQSAYYVFEKKLKQQQQQCKQTQLMLSHCVKCIHLWEGQSQANWTSKHNLTYADRTRRWTKEIKEIPENIHVADHRLTGGGESSQFYLDSAKSQQTCLKTLNIKSRPRPHSIIKLYWIYQIY